MSEDRFDQEAEAWDSKPIVVETSKKTFQVLKDRLKPSYDVLEIGCGTGLLSALLAPHVGRILGVDTSTGMIAKYQSKRDQYPNIEGKVMLLEKQEQIPDRTDGRFELFDLVVSHLVFHHIPVMLPTVQVAFECLKPGGSLVITDFERTPDSRAFHPESKMADVERHGLGREEMQELLIEAGFKDVEVQEAYVQNQIVESGASQDFPFLMCIGVKS